MGFSLLLWRRILMVVGGCKKHLWLGFVMVLIIFKMMSGMRKIFVVGLLFWLNVGFGQGSIRDSSLRMSLVSVHYSADFPGGNMADRFGWNSEVGIGYRFKTKGNYLFGIRGSYLFGNDVREVGIMSNITTPDGNLLGDNGQYGNVILYERGFDVMVDFGKLFPVMGPNPNSGIYVLGGVGFLEHKISIYDENKNVPQVDGVYAAGYDRMTNGLALSQSVGYMHLGNRHLMNFYIGFEMLEGFTENRRPVNFETGLKDNTKRFDILYGVTFGWILPLYKRAPNAFYYY